MTDELTERENNTNTIVPPSQASEELLAGQFRRWLAEVSTRIRSIGGNLTARLMGKDRETSFTVLNQREDAALRIRDDGSLEIMGAQVFAEPWILARLQEGTNWSDYFPSTYGEACYYKQPLGCVMLRGLIKDGTGMVCDLPLTHHPINRHWIFPVITETGIGRIDVMSDQVQLPRIQYVNGSTNWLSLSGIEFCATHWSWDNLPLINGWTNYGSSFNTAGAYKDSLGMVWLKGRINYGTSVVFAQPPSSFLPPRTEIFPAITSSGASTVVVRSVNDLNGQWSFYGGAGFTWASIDNVRFQTRDDVWIAPNLINGWVNAGGNAATAGYWRDPFGVVRLRGTIYPGSGTIFTLPAGYRPPKEMLFPAAAGATPPIRSISVGTDGSVSVNASNVDWLSLSGIAFRVA